MKYVPVTVDRFAEALEVICVNSGFAGCVLGNLLTKDSFRVSQRGVGNHMMTYTIADFLIQIKNGYMAHKDTIEVPFSKMKGALAELLKKEGYLSSIEVKNKNTPKSRLIAGLVYEGKNPKVTQITIVSKPGKRVYVGKKRIPKVLGGLGITILSTPLGLMADRQAREKGVGGEIICKIW